MWEHVFSPHAMMIDAAAGLVVFVLRLLRPSRPPSKLEVGAIALVAVLVNHRYLTGSAARAMPTGYAGAMVQVCTQQESRERCLCAVDALEKRIGEPAVVRLGVRAEVNLALPKEFLDALAECRG